MDRWIERQVKEQMDGRMEEQKMDGCMMDVSNMQNKPLLS